MPARAKIEIVRVGPVVPARLRLLREDLVGCLRRPVWVGPESLDLTPAFDPSRGQYSVEPLLERLGRGIDPRLVRLGVTDADLFLPVFTHVLGAAQLGGPAGIVSCFRLVGGKARGDEERLRGRLLREALHELGHCFGLIHCRRSWCSMAPARSVEEVDLRDAAYCPECARRSALRET